MRTDFGFHEVLGLAPTTHLAGEVEVLRLLQESPACLLGPGEPSPEGEVLPERVPFGVVVGHEDPAQVRVPRERDAEHVVDLTLQPIRRLPQVHHGLDLQRIQRHFGLHPQGVVVGEGEELVDHLQRGAPAVVHAGDVGAELVLLAGVVLEPRQDVIDSYTELTTPATETTEEVSDEAEPVAAEVG